MQPLQKFEPADVVEIVQYIAERDELLLELRDKSRRVVRRGEIETDLGKMATDFFNKWYAEQSEQDTDSEENVEDDLIKPVTSPYRPPSPSPPVQQRDTTRHSLPPSLIPAAFDTDQNTTKAATSAAEMKQSNQGFAHSREKSPSQETFLGRGSIAPPHLISPHPSQSPTKSPTNGDDQTRMPLSHSNGPAVKNASLPTKEDAAPSDAKEAKEVEVSNSSGGVKEENSCPSPSPQTNSPSKRSPEFDTTSAALQTEVHSNASSTTLNECSSPPPPPPAAAAPSSSLHEVEATDDGVASKKAESSNPPGSTTDNNSTSMMSSSPFLSGPSLIPSSNPQHLPYVNVLPLAPSPQPDAIAGPSFSDYQYFPASSNQFYPYHMIFNDVMNVAPVNPFQSDIYTNDHFPEASNLGKTTLPLPPSIDDSNVLSAVQQAPIQLPVPFHHVGSAPKPPPLDMMTAIGNGTNIVGSTVQAGMDSAGAGGLCWGVSSYPFVNFGKGKATVKMGNKTKLGQQDGHVCTRCGTKFETKGEFEQHDQSCGTNAEDGETDHSRHLQSDEQELKGKRSKSKSSRHRSKSTKSSRSRKSKSSKTENGERTSSRRSKRSGLRSGTKLSDAGVHARRTEEFFEKFSGYHGWQDREKSDDDSDFHVQKKSRKKGHKRSRSRSRSRSSSQGRKGERHHQSKRYSDGSVGSDDDAGENGNGSSKGGTRMDVDGTSKRGRTSVKKASSSRRNGSKKGRSKSGRAARSSSRNASPSPSYVGSHSSRGGDGTRNHTSRKKRYKPDSEAVHDRASKRRRKGSRERHSKTTPSSISSATEKAEGEKEKIYPCPYCDKLYPSITSRKNHQRSHNNHFPCWHSDCLNLTELEKSRAFMTFVDLNAHWRDKHRSKKKASFMCWVCNKSFQSDPGRMRHGRIHGCLKTEFLEGRVFLHSDKDMALAVVSKGHEEADRGAVTGPVVLPGLTPVVETTTQKTATMKHDPTDTKDKTLSSLSRPANADDGDVAMSDQSSYSPKPCGGGGGGEDDDVNVEDAPMSIDKNAPNETTLTSSSIDSSGLVSSQGKKRRLEGIENSRRPLKRPHIECRVCKNASFSSEALLGEHIRQNHKKKSADDPSAKQDVAKRPLRYDFCPRPLDFAVGLLNS